MLRYLKHVEPVIGALTRGRERDHLRAWGFSPEALDERIDAVLPEIGPLLGAYGREISAPDHAVSLESAALLAALAETMEPARTLDTGSGFSSYVLRRYRAHEDAVVWSVDDDAGWMKRTRAYLEEHGVLDERLMEWTAFAATDERAFDLVFHDLGQAREIRADVLPEICDRLAPGGLLVLDDFHKRAYRARICPVLEHLGFEVLVLRDFTLDGYGRYAALARRTAKAP